MVAGDRELPWRANAPRYECDRSAAELGDGGPLKIGGEVCWGAYWSSEQNSLGLCLRSVGVRTNLDPTDTHVGWAVRTNSDPADAHVGRDARMFSELSPLPPVMAEINLAPRRNFPRRILRGTEC